MTTIIGLLGPAGAGKSSVAGYLVEHYGAKRYSLATPLKEIAKRTLDFTDEQLYGTQEQKEAIDPRYGFSCRKFLQRLGTEGCRAVLGPDVWTQACLRQIREDKPDVAVIEDLRFVNEAAAIQEEDRNRTGYAIGYVWRLRPPEDGESLARAVAAGNHASESEWLEAPADLEIAPKRRGLEELFEFADAAAHGCHLVRR